VSLQEEVTVYESSSYRSDWEIISRGKGRSTKSTKALPKVSDFILSRVRKFKHKGILKNNEDF
jgi:hypothetical protein